MGIRIHIAIASCILALASVAGNVIDPFFVSFNPSSRTAYHSRGRICDDRPTQMTLTKVGFDTKDYGDFGKIGLWNFTVSSFGDRYNYKHRQALHEMDYGIFWSHYVDFSEYSDSWKGWGFSTDILKDWITLPGYTAPYHAKKSDATMNEWRIEQAVKNPYITPYYLLRRCLHPRDWLYVRVGVRKTIPITDTLSFSTDFFGENGNKNHFEVRYGKMKDGTNYHTGLMALNLQCELAWQISKNVSAYANVHQFCVTNDDGRDQIKTTKSSCGRRDLTIGTIGMRLRF